MWDILAAARSFQAAVETSVAGLGMLAELQGKGLCTSSLFGLNTSEQLSQNATAFLQNYCLCQSTARRAIYPQATNVAKVAKCPAQGHNASRTLLLQEKRSQRAEARKLYHLLALRIRICLTLCDGSQEETLLKEKE